MRLAARIFAGTSLLLIVTVVGLLAAADVVLRRHLEDQIAIDLGREARLAAALVPPDSLRWPAAAQQIGALTGHRVTLIDPTGRVRGDTEFGPAALGRLENHLLRPEVQAALAGGVGRSSRLSASTNEQRLYVAIRGGPPGLAVVRVSTTLAAVDLEVATVQRGIALAGLAALLVAVIVAWMLARAVARPLVQLSAAARAIAAGASPDFPGTTVPEVAEHVFALRAMHQQLLDRFTALTREREESRTLIESMADGVIAADAHGVIVTANPAAQRLLGFRADAPPPLPELFHDKGTRELVRAALDGRDAPPEELEANGRSLFISARGLPAGGALLMVADVTDFRRLEAVRRDFVANVSHELKTPLTSIAGYAETLAGETERDPEARRFAETILKNARRMQRLVEDLLDLSRIESGHWRPERRVIEIAPIAREVWTTLGDRGRKIEFAVDVPAGAATVVADPDALRGIFTNLFDNAVRHTPDGGRIGVSAAQEPDGVAITVSDTGSGIPSEHLPRVFERFYRVDPARSRDQGGTGLGLAIVKHLMEAHGGTATAESAVGRGTSVRLAFPAVTKP